MEYCIASFSSITVANRVKGKIPKVNGFVGVMQTPSSLSQGGCGYSLRFKITLLKTIKSVVGELNVKVKGYYAEVNQNGIISYEKIE